MVLSLISCSTCFEYSSSVILRRSSVSPRDSLRPASLALVPSSSVFSLSAASTNSSSLTLHCSMRSASTSLLLFWYSLRLLCASWSSLFSCTWSRLHFSSFFWVSFSSLSILDLATAASCWAFSHFSLCVSALVCASMI